jgi:N-acetylglucosamine-6-phosphate deacetylase
VRAGQNPGPGRADPSGETLIAAARLVPATDGTGVLEPGYLAFTGGVLTAVAAGPPPRAPDISLRSGVLVPGLVDLQVNGYFGVELSEVSEPGWAEVITRLPSTGVTAFLPTFITAPLDRLAGSLRSARALVSRLPRGSRVLGVHAERPFISPLRKGAHNPAWIADPSPDAVAALLAAGDGVLRLVTLAPERPGALAAITELAGAGVVVSVGHSDARATEVSRAADHGARMVTHLFNAQRGLHHREPGVPGAALSDARLTSGLITDLHHVDAAVCRIAFAAAPGRICIVTDAAACAGMPPGRYLLGGEPIELPAGAGEPPVRADGVISGSALRLDAGVANMVGAGLDLAEAVAAASRVPADLVGRPDLGRIASGAAADLTWLDDDLRTAATWIGGRQVFGAAPGA